MRNMKVNLDHAAVQHVVALAGAPSCIGVRGTRGIAETGPRRGGSAEFGVDNQESVSGESRAVCGDLSRRGEEIPGNAFGPERGVEDIARTTFC